MKNLIILGTLAITSIFPIKTFAEGTWIKVYEIINTESPMCQSQNLCGFAGYVDAKSMVRQGQFAYFNFTAGSLELDKWGNLIKSGPVAERGFSGWVADCKNKRLKGPIGGWTEVQSKTKKSQKLNFVCR